MRLTKIVLPAIVVLMLLPPGLQAYGKTWSGAELERLIKEAGFRLGPFRVKTVFILNDAGYDSNVYRTNDHPVQDYSLTAGPSFTVYLPIKKKIVLTFYESPQYVYFARTEQERTWNNYLMGRIQLVLNRILVTGEAGFSVAREIWSTEIDIRPQRKATSALASILWQTSRKTSFNFEARETKFSYEDLSYENFNLREELNHRERVFDAAVYYQASYRIRARIEAEYDSYSFDSPGNPRNSESRCLYGGFDFGPGGSVDGRIRLGLKYFDAVGQGVPGFRGLVGDSAIGLQLGKTFRLRASYARDVQFSTWYGYVYFIENRAGGGVSLYLSRNVRLDYDYSQGQNNYPRAEADNENSSEARTDLLRLHRVGLYFRIKGRIGLGLTANWWQRESTIDWIKGKRLFVGANLTYDF